MMMLDAPRTDTNTFTIQLNLANMSLVLMLCNAIQQWRQEEHHCELEYQGQGRAKRQTLQQALREPLRDQELGGLQQQEEAGRP